MGMSPLSRCADPEIIRGWPPVRELSRYRTRKKHIRRAACVILAGIGSLVAVLERSALATTDGSGSSRSARASTGLPAPVNEIMQQARYAHASWSLIVTDLETGKTLYTLAPDRLAFTGSVRKLFSVGLALRRLGANHRFTTAVYRRGRIDAQGRLHGNLVLRRRG